MRWERGRGQPPEAVSRDDKEAGRSQEWWLMLAALALWKLRQEDCYEWGKCCTYIRI